VIGEEGRWIKGVNKTDREEKGRGKRMNQTESPN
jgi:hypothetical protein